MYVCYRGIHGDELPRLPFKGTCWRPSCRESGQAGSLQLLVPSTTGLLPEVTPSRAATHLVTEQSRGIKDAAIYDLMLDKSDGTSHSRVSC